MNMALTYAHTRVVSAYIGTASSLPDSAVEEINERFVAAGLAPVYTAKRLQRALYNRMYRRKYGSCSYGKWLERRAETMQEPATEEEVDTMVTWMEGQRGGDGSCVEEWPDIDEMDAAWEAAMRSLVPLSLRDPNNADDFY